MLFRYTHSRRFSTSKLLTDWALPLLLIAPLKLTGQVQNVQLQGATATQAVISFDVPDPANCLVQVSTDSNFVNIVNDTNAILFPGSSNCNRAGSSVFGTHVTFVAGTRTSRLGSDGIFHSLALEANRLQYYRIISQGTDVFACDPGQSCIRTANPRFGNTFPEPDPFDSAAPYNYAWPTVRPGLDRNTWIIDPLSGIAVSMWSAPVPVNNNGPIVTNSPGVHSFDAANHGNWTTLCAATGGANCVNSSANQDPLFIRLTPWCVANPFFTPVAGTVCPQGQSTWTEPGIDQTQFNTIDDIQVQISGSVSGSTTGMQFALTEDGVNPATDWQSQTLTGTLTSHTYPPTGAASGGVITTPGYPATQFGTGSNATTFGYWFANFATSRLTRPDLQPHAGTLTVASSGVVAWTSGEMFRMSSMSVGSYITLFVSSVNIDYQITAVNSPTSITIANPPSAGTYAYLYQQFGVLVRKAAATTGNLTVGGAVFSDFESAVNTTPITALVDICATYTVTDSSGAVLRPCMLLEGFQHPIYLIDENTGASRFIGLEEQNGGCFSGHCTPGVTSHLNDYGQVSINAAFGQTFLQVQNHWMLVAPDTGGNKVVVDGSYNPAGSGSCPNGWKEITLANCPTYPYNDNMTFFNAMPKFGADGKDHTPVAQATAYATAHSLAVFDAASFSTFSGGIPTDTTNGWVEFLFSPSLQNFPGWFAKYDPANSYNIVAMGNTYTSYNCRFCADHGSNSLSGYENISTEAALPICSGVGCGPMVLQSNTSTNNSTVNTCSGITDPNFTSYNGTANCFDLTLAGSDPCLTTPNGANVAPMYGTCGWNGSFSHLAGITVAVGDLLGDAAWASSVTGEMFRVVVIPSANVIRVIRAYATPAVQTGQFASASSLTAHTVPWQLTEMCSASAGSNGGQAWFNLNIDPTAQNGIVDYPSYITGHADWWITGDWIEAEGRFRIYPSLGAMIGAPNTFFAGEEGPFAAVGGGGGIAFVESHGSVSRDANNPHYEVDSSPYSSASVASNKLWPQIANNVTGALWHIAAANVQNAGQTWPAAIKAIPFVAWSGEYLLQDISGPSSAIDDTTAHNWQFCVVYIAGECVAGSAIGDVYMNVPQSAHNGVCGPWDYSRNLCATLLDSVATGVNQFDYSRVATGQCGATGCNAIPGGSLFRRLSNLFNRYNFQSVFSSAHGAFGGQWVFGHSDAYGGGLRSDLFIVKLPPSGASDQIDRSGFVNLPVKVGPYSRRGVNARVRFGYSENGPATAFFCAYNRKESCISNPNPTSANPYYFASDPSQAAVPCVSGCNLSIPAIPGRVVYYVVDRVDGLGNVINTSSLQIGFVP